MRQRKHDIVLTSLHNTPIQSDFRLSHSQKRNKRRSDFSLVVEDANGCTWLPNMEVQYHSNDKNNNPNPLVLLHHYMSGTTLMQNKTKWINDSIGAFSHHQTHVRYSSAMHHFETVPCFKTLVWLHHRFILTFTSYSTVTNISFYSPNRKQMKKNKTGNNINNNWLVISSFCLVSYLKLLLYQLAEWFPRHVQCSKDYNIIKTWGDSKDNNMMKT